tara:strand:- start:794 stop:1036 length:243 start_codon:yes stop_codon:yes gene_type:complete
MEVLTGRELMRLKEEYASAVVENMTRQQALSYLQQIIYNDVAVESGEAVAKKVIRAFGEDMYNSMVADITTRTSGSPVTK